MSNITDWNQVPEVFDIPYMARLMGAKPSGIKRQCQAGELPAFKMGKLWRFRKDDVAEYMSQQRNVYRVGARRGD